jgi:hypothetical protein
LAKAGHVIEFADGTLDLPLPPKLIEADKGGLPASHQAGHDPAKVETAASHDSVSAGDEFEGGAEEEIHASVEAGETTTAEPDQVPDSPSHSEHPEEANVDAEAQDNARGSTDSKQNLLSQPSKLQLEKNDEDECATAGSGSRLA